MSAPAPQGPGGFSLFPNTSTRPPSRNQRTRAPTPQSVLQEPSSSVETTPPRPGRKMSVRRAESVRDGKQPVPDSRQSSFDRREETTVTVPPPVADIPPRCDTAFSEARTLVRSNSNRSHSSIAKPMITYTPAPPSSTVGEPALRSIFPQYNPDVPLDRQDYYPTQNNGTQLPMSAISRPLYSPSNVEPRSPPTRSPLVSPLSGGSSRWPPRINEPPAIPPESTTEDLKSLWKVANGWKAPVSEGRVYCMKMLPEKDTPVYTLSSATQPFYNLRIDPTSASAYVTLSRYDPNKPFKGAAPPNSSVLATPSSSSKADAKNWQEVLSTTLEEESRKQPPNDGLVALLYPTAAAKLALDRPDDMTTVLLAEHECARLVWDADSGSHYLVHQALAMPFCVTVERNPAWSRTEYTLEHIESPQHLARLTRDGTGVGWLEIDTAIAAKIDSVYLVDVVVAALMLVAHNDEKFTKVEVFEPPPMLRSPTASLSSKGERRLSSRLSRSSRRGSAREERREKDRKPPKMGRSRMEQFEIDIESQTSELGKLGKVDLKGKDDLPGTARGLIKILTVFFKCIIWLASLAFKALMAIIAGLAKCLASDKL